ncbi:IclR family transcriptional regulator [Brachybacterium sp. AOP35-5H-19]|uniref:IclR family transcriptional regulator n=1 Tax=Brachybacterium sp. AOP35-5H-19 TaxID=3457685 RepID=UPI004034B118
MLILSAFEPSDSSLRLAELVRRTELPKTTAHRLINELVELRLLERTANYGLRLGGRLFELGMLASEHKRLFEVAMPFMQDLCERVRETVHLAIRDGTDVVYVAKIAGHRQVSSPSRMGGRMPLHCTAVGKVLLAHADDDTRRQVLTSPLERRSPRTVTAPGTLSRQLERALENGYATENEESAPGLSCIAAPVLDESGRIRAAISISGATSRFRPEQRARDVCAAAQGIGVMISRREVLFAGL